MMTGLYDTQAPSADRWVATMRSASAIAAAASSNGPDGEPAPASARPGVK